MEAAREARSAVVPGLPASGLAGQGQARSFEALKGPTIDTFLRGTRATPRLDSRRDAAPRPPDQRD